MEILIWIAFIAFIIFLLVLDLGVFHRKSHMMKSKEALSWTIVWIAVALVFNIFIYYAYQYNWYGIGTKIGIDLTGKDAALLFFTGYLIEKSLSVDNIFVIAMVFSYFSVPVQYQHKILFYGIVGALVMRGVMIVLGAALINNFNWITYVFGLILVVSAVRLLIVRHDNVDPYKNPTIKFVRRYFKVSDKDEGDRFFTRVNGKMAVTPLFVVLMVIETTDLMFAVDSIPAIFAITTDPFIVFTSNVFAIMGLRALYFVLSSFMDKFRFLKMSLVFVLAFVGVKMILLHHHKFPVFVSLGIIASILAVGILASLLYGEKDTAKLEPPPTLASLRQDHAGDHNR